MKRTIATIAAFLALALLALAAVACEDDKKDDGGATPTGAATEPGETPAEGATVDVDLSEYAILPDPTSAPAGSVTFNANNVGGTPHELVVIRTDLAADALPTADDGSVDESGAGIEVIGEIEEFDPDATEPATFDLEAGSYVLICNVVQDDGVSHYGKGMSIAFPVQ